MYLLKTPPLERILTNMGFFVVMFVLLLGVIGFIFRYARKVIDEI